MNQTRFNSMMTAGVFALLSISFYARATPPEITAQLPGATKGGIVDGTG